MRIAFSLICLFFLSACQNNTPSSEYTAKVENRGTNKENWWDKLPRPAWEKFQKIKTNSIWFDVHQITPNIIAIYEPGQFEEVISYLIIGEQKALLWDTGTGIGDMKKMVSELTNLEVMILNSHTHYDHVGGNHQFDQIFGINTEFTHQNAQGKGHEVAKEFISGDWIWKQTPATFSKEKYESKPFKITQYVKHQDQIDLGGIVLEVLQTPGHTPDAICLLDRSNRLLFTGDTFYPAPLYAHFGESNVETYLKTANFLATLTDEIDYILPSHNEPWLPSIYLQKMATAFQQIKDGKADYVETDGAKEYTFEGFSIITK